MTPLMPFLPDFRRPEIQVSDRGGGEPVAPSSRSRSFDKATKIRKLSPAASQRIVQYHCVHRCTIFWCGRHHQVAYNPINISTIVSDAQLKLVLVDVSTSLYSIASG